MKKFQDEDLHAVKQLLAFRNHNIRREEAKRNHDRQFYPVLNLFRGGRIRSTVVSNKIESMLRRRANELKGPVVDSQPFVIQTAQPNERASNAVDKIDFLFQKISDQIEAVHINSKLYDDCYRLLKMLQQDGYLLDRVDINKYAEFTATLISAMNSVEVQNNVENMNTSDAVILALEKIQTMLMTMLSKVDLTEDQRKMVYKAISKQSSAANFKKVLDKITRIIPEIDIEDYVAEPDVEEAVADGVGESKGDEDEFHTPGGAAELVVTAAKSPEDDILPFSIEDILTPKKKKKTPKTKDTAEAIASAMHPFDTMTFTSTRTGSSFQVPATREDFRRVFNTKQRLLNIASRIAYNPRGSTSTENIQAYLIRQIYANK